MATNTDDMARFLPERVRIAKTPDNVWRNSTTEVVMETVELKTRDVIAAFMAMQQQAIQRARELKDERLRAEAIKRIRAMTHFRPNDLGNRRSAGPIGGASGSPTS